MTPIPTHPSHIVNNIHNNQYDRPLLDIVTPRITFYNNINMEQHHQQHRHRQTRTDHHFTNSSPKPCATSPATSTTSAFTASTTPFLLSSDLYHAVTALNFLPDFTEHPKPKRRKSVVQEPVSVSTDSEGDEVTFLQDFVAGGMAGSASVIVGHPLDTIKVRIQNSHTGGILSSITEFGGVTSLFRGMAAPLGTAAAINAIVFSSYGMGSRWYDSYIADPELEDTRELNHDPPEKAFVCGSFAGLVQCVVICPMEHIKCRLQVQHGKGKPDNLFKGPVEATRGILQRHGVSRLYQGWWSTVLREVPAFGLYFAVYDHMKDRVNTFLAKRAGVDPQLSLETPRTHTWIASAIAGGIAGSATWAIVYPVDVIKTHVQTMPLDTPRIQLSMYRVGSQIVAKHGWRHLFRGLGITLIRAFPVNGTIFPVYEFTLMQVSNWNF